MTTEIAQRTMAALNLPGMPARAARIGGGRASEVYLVQAAECEVIAYLLPAGASREARRRFAILERITKRFRLAPRPLAIGDSADGGSILLLVERFHGVAPTTCYAFSPEASGRLGRNFITVLATLHAIEISPGDQPLGYVHRSIRDWQRRWNEEEAEGMNDEFQAVVRWLKERPEDSSPAAFLHNDFKLDNILVDPGDPARIVGVVDWELATIGHPLADLGIMLAYWIESRDSSLLRLDAPGPSYVPGAPTREALVDLYAQACGREVAQPTYWYAYGLLRLAVITQQLALRHRENGQQVPRSRLIVRLLLSRAAQVCGGGQL